MLYLISTPIGNLSDISFRAIETLKQCDLILCEDTRHSKPLLVHYGITTSLKSYHKFSENAQLDTILSDLSQGREIALISDAGTPCISDPGNLLVRACRERGIPVTSVPGACALLSALVISGFETAPFQFVGFLPKKQTELTTMLAGLLSYRGASICYESPQRIGDTLRAIGALSPERQVCLCRELTKKFEQAITGTPEEVLAGWERSAMKGEIVLILSPPPVEKEHEKLSVAEHVDYAIAHFHLPKKEAIRLVAEMRGMQKRAVYELYHKKSASAE